MKTSHRLSAVILLLLFPPVIEAQICRWTDAAGKEHRSDRFEDIPGDALERAWVEIRGVGAKTGDTIEVEGGHAVRLIGVDAPEPESDTDVAAIEEARKQLDLLVAGRDLTLRFDKNLKDHDSKTLAYVESVATGSINAAILEKGLARCSIRIPNVRCSEELYAAQERAKGGRSGLWAKYEPREKGNAARLRAGFSLGLFSREEHYDYRPFLRELVAIRATDVMLITPWFMETHESLSIKRRQFRTCSIGVVETVARQARELGLIVTLMPIVLLTNAPADKWRGNIKPPDIDDWFAGYDEFITPFADLAQRTGVEMLAVGSELSSLESHTTHWRQIVKNIRRRFDGLLTYSANWDHLDTIQWWRDLDMIGMTGYHSLTKSNEPTIVELTNEWTRIRASILKILENKGMPYAFTEMGYASLDGINKDPWDYVSPKTVDNDEQADCYAAWIEAWRERPDRFAGAWFYTWWRNNDADDARQYTVHGKPAEKVIRRWFEELKDR